MPPKISVVVSFGNVEPYFEACLESLAAQTLRDIEVIMVDDGSTDNSAVVAKSRAATDPRFHLVHDYGPDSAVDAGIRQATGEYLAFADGRDTVPECAYELLTGSLDRTGSDIACGNVAEEAQRFKTSVTATHITRTPALLADRVIWNKAYRTRFWRDSGLSCTDPAVIVRAHVLAEAVDVLAATVYTRRERTGETDSATEQDRADARRIEARMAAARAACDVLAEHAPRLLPRHHRDVLDGALGALAEALPKVAEPDRDRLLELGSEFVRTVDSRVLGALPALGRLRYHLLGRRMLPELLEVMSPFEQDRVSGAPVVRRRARLRTRWYATYPFFEDPVRAIPRHVYDVTGELRLRARVDDIRWRDGRLRIEGHAYITRLDVSTVGDARIRLWLEDVNRRTRIDLPVQRIPRPDVTAEANQPAVCYDWSGFAAEIDPGRLRQGGRWRAAGWELRVEVVTRGVRLGRALRDARPTWPDPYEVAGGVLVQPVVGGARFVVQVKPVRALVTAARCADGALCLDGWTAIDPGPVASLVASSGSDRAVRVPAEITRRPDGRYGFRARLAPDDLPDDLPDDAAQWDICLVGAGHTTKLATAAGIDGARCAVAGRELVVTRTRHGNLRCLVRPCRPVVDGVRWTDDGLLVLTGAHVGSGDRPDRLTLRRHRTNEEHTVGLAWAGERFTAEFAPSAVPVLGARAPLAAGLWNLVVRTGEGETALLIERRGDLPGTQVLGVHEVEVFAQADELRLRVRPALAADERGAYAQERLRTRDYPRYRAQPLRDLVVFDSFRSRQYSCNPRAIYETLRRERADLEYVWVSCDGQFTAPYEARTVLSGSREHYAALARARYVVSNESQPPWFAKRDGQVYVQCWHGTPLKRLGLDVPAMPHMRKAVRDWIERDVRQWDLLVSPNPFTSPIMRQAYEYDGEILESGYPRNDILNSPERDRIAAEVRARLGIPAHKRVVLYVPTWRDDNYLALGRRGFDLALDLERARRALGDDHVLLLRTHYLVTDRSWSQMDDFVVDVTRYPDIAELYLIADVLLTDYSSAMFDFAVTGKPIVFFAYDLERYRDKVRGFYFDLGAEAPGPLLRTSEKVIEALRDIDQAAGAHAESYAAFTAKFCPHDDGQAATRVITRLTAGG